MFTFGFHLTNLKGLKNFGKVNQSFKMKTPPSLQKGDLIAFASPARSIKAEELQTAIQFFEENGYKVKIDSEVNAVFNQFAGDDEKRAQHFQSLLDDPLVKAIVCSRGGYGSLRIVDKLDFSQFEKSPKWIVGYSDITVFHAQLLKLYNAESIHGSMPVNFATNSTEALTGLIACLEGKSPDYFVSQNSMNRAGKACGQLIGGNLSILYSLQGSLSFPDSSGNILFIEDLDEYLYHIDRMVLSLKRGGLFDGIAGLIVGGMTEMKDNTIPFGKTAEEIILEHVDEYDFPVCFGFPAGHIRDNLPLIMGRKTTLEVHPDKMVRMIQ
jgi:muramoyltetrapeptide carboxypeptidase